MAAQEIVDEIQRKPDIVLGLATGVTPVGLLLHRLLPELANLGPLHGPRQVRAGYGGTPEAD